jgi:hypothetical protein
MNSPVNTPTPTICQRCGAEFNCGVLSNVPCQCFGVRLSSQALEIIKKEGYSGCLCNKCLKEIELMVDKSTATYPNLPSIG